MIRPLLILMLCSRLSACTETVQLQPGDPLPGLVSLTVTPGDHRISLTELQGPPVTLAYTATGRFEDGSERDVTSQVQWRVDNPLPGTFIEPGTYQTSQRAAGRAIVAAHAGAITGTATLTVEITVTIVDSTFPPPLGADELFAPGIPVVVDSTRSPAILYPSDGTLVPQGLQRIVFQHVPGQNVPGQNNDALRLTFESELLHLTVLTSAVRWQPDDALWSLIAGSNAGSQTTFVVAGASTTMPGTIYASMPARLAFARTDPGGVLYFWSAGGNKVLRTTLASSAATPAYPAPADATCVGCHVVSRDGRQMAVGYRDETLQSFDLATGVTTVSATARHPMGWATYSPDGTLLLVADRGELVLRDARTGQPVGSPDGRVVLASKVTHPDWSPDGGHVVVAVSGDVSNMDVKNASIARIPFTDGGFGVPEILVAGSAMDNNYFPRWSPDGRFIAYVHATTGSRGAKSAELRLIRADGGEPVVLRRASHFVAGVDVPDLANLMPSWAPSSSASVAWLAFSSTRPYGAIMPNADRGQIWIAGLDLTREGDPSFAAFWLPSQDVRVLANNPIWAVVPTPPPR